MLRRCSKLRILTGPPSTNNGACAISSAATTASIHTTDFMASGFFCVHHTFPRDAIDLKRNKNLYPRRSFSSKSDGITTTLHSKWIQSTEKLLDREVTVVGSFDSLKWQLAETMIIHWAETGGSMGLEKCFQILDRLIDEAVANPDANHKLDIYLVHSILKSWNRLLKQSEVNLLPSQVLERIDSHTSRANCYEPNIVTYTMILDGASRCPIPNERLAFTEKLLLRLIEEADTNPHLRPTVVSFGTVINAWARSGNRNAAEKAEGLLWRVHDLHESGWPDMEPNTTIFTSAINAWGNAGDPERAELLLKKMYENCMLGENKNVQPNEWSFNSVISAWGKSESPKAYESAEALLRLMIELKESKNMNCKPSVVTYNCLLRILRKRQGDPDAFEKAELLVEEMIERANSTGDKEVLPDLITFTALFRLMATSGIPNENEKAEFWMKQAKSLGFSEERFLLDQHQTAKWIQHRDNNRNNRNL